MNTQNLEFAEQATITASVLPDELRIGFWPQHFGSIPQWITLEPRIFAWMVLLCVDYHGGIWNFSTLANAAAVVLAHNHPSGDPEPSKADRQMTDKLKEVLGLVDVKTLDHLVVGQDGIVSFAERGWI